MIINEIEIENFKQLKKYQFNFDSQFTLIIGSNGTGKTSVLEALSVSLGGFLAGLDVGQSRSIYTDEIRKELIKVGDATVTFEPQLPVIISTSGTISGNEITWTRTREMLKNGRTTRLHARVMTDYARSLQDKIRKSDNDVILPVISYQSAGRLFSQKKNKWHDPFKREELSRFLGYTDCLDSESNIKLFVNWLRKMSTIKVQRGKSIGELSSVINAVRIFMSGFHDNHEINLYYDFEIEEAVVEIGDQAIPLRMMSAGYRSVIGMVSDIAYRMSLLNPQLKEEAASKTPGVVLIDEIDLHLHPEWQWKIIESLKATFPSVQFIATTHAPIVISSCRDAKIISLHDENESTFQSKKAPYGWQVEDVLTNIMHTIDQVPSVSNKVIRYEDLYAKKLMGAVSAEEIDEVESLRIELFSILPSSNPAVTLAKIRAIGENALGADQND